MKAKISIFWARELSAKLFARSRGQIEVADREIPNRAWAFWAQGEKNLDPMVEICIESWRLYGGFEEIHVLDASSVFSFVPRDSLPSSFPTLPVQIQSDLVRLALLGRYGGVWMDASTLVTFPVVAWLNRFSRQSGLFLFQNPGAGKGGRRFETGVIAAVGGHPFVEAWLDLMVRFFRRPRIHRAHSATSDAPMLAKKVFAALNVFLRKTARRSAFWAWPPLVWLPFYPFFIVHYLGNRVLSRQEHRGLLDSVELVTADKYLNLRRTSNDLGWVEALLQADLTRVPTHDVEFRKESSDEEISALKSFLSRARS